MDRRSGETPGNDGLVFPVLVEAQDLDSGFVS
jgi:hypothetical protein